MVNALKEAIGKSASWIVNGVTVGVEILDARTAYGRTDYLIAPIIGKGQKWISEDLIIIEKDVR